MTAEEIMLIIRATPLSRRERTLMRRAVKESPPARRGRKPQDMCAAGIHALAETRRKGRGGCSECNNVNSKLRRCGVDRNAE